MTRIRARRSTTRGTMHAATWGVAVTVAIVLHTPTLPAQIPGAGPGLSADSLYLLARQALAARNYHGAADVFQRIVVENPKAVIAGEALYWRGYALYASASERHDLADARQALDAIEAQERSFPRASSDGDGTELRARVLALEADLGDPAATQTLAAATVSVAAGGAVRSVSCDMLVLPVQMVALERLFEQHPAAALSATQGALESHDRCAIDARRRIVAIALGSPGVDAAKLRASVSDPEVLGMIDAYLNPVSRWTTYSSQGQPYTEFRIPKPGAVVRMGENGPVVRVDTQQTVVLRRESELVLATANDGGSPTISMLPTGSGAVAGLTSLGVTPAQPLSAMRHGEIAISAPVIVRPAVGGEAPVTEAAAALQRMLGSMRFAPRSRIGVYWETYGIGEGEPVDVSVAIWRGADWLRRASPDAGSALTGGTVVRWHEPAPGRAVTTVRGPVPIQSRNISLDLGPLPAGDYVIEVSVARPGQAPLAGDRGITILAR